MATRIVRGTFLDSQDQPMVGLVVTLRMSPAYYDADGHRVYEPPITVTTDAQGQIEVDLTIGAQYKVHTTGLKDFAIIVNDGDDTLETLHASLDSSEYPTDTVMIAIEGALVDYVTTAALTTALASYVHEDDFETVTDELEAADAANAAAITEETNQRQAHTDIVNGNPHGTTAAQVGADPTGTATAAINTHLAASDPHPQYQTQPEGDARYGLLAAMYGPRLAVGNWHHVNIAAATLSTIASNLGWLWLLPMLVTRSFTANAVRLETTVAGVATTTFVGLYAHDEATGLPAARLADFGSVASTSVAVYDLVISQPLAPGRYWMALLTTGTTAPTVRATSTGLPAIIGGPSLAANGNISGLYVTGQTGLPATLAAASFGSASFVPTVLYRVGALS